MKKLNILIVTEVFFPDVIGGAGRVVYELGKRLVKRGHNVYILARMLEKSLASEEVIEGIKVYRYKVNPANTISLAVSTLVNSLKVFKRLNKKTFFDVINFHQPLGSLGITFSKKTRLTPKIYTFHSAWFKEYEIKMRKKRGVIPLMMRLIERRVLSVSQKIITLSEYSKRELVRIHKLPAAKIVIIPGGVDIEQFKPIEDKKTVRTELDIPPNKFILLTVRNLVPRMGLENLVRAMAGITKVTKEIMLIIGGEGVLGNKLKGIVRDLGLGNYVKFTGFIGEDRLSLYYQAADVFILPTKYLEGFGLVTLEALASGTPVLGTAVGGTEELLGKLDENLLLSGTDSSSISKSILRFINSNKYRDSAKRWRSFAEEYSWDNIVLKVEKSFYELLR